jgi:hypothetical protein
MCGGRSAVHPAVRADLRQPDGAHRDRVTDPRRAGTIGEMEAAAEYQYAPLRIPPGTSRSAAATMLSLQADTGGWELARLQLHADGTRKVLLRRRARLSYLPGPVI